MNELTDGKEFAQELDRVRDAGALAYPDPGSPSLTAEHSLEGSVAVEETYDLLSFNQVVENFGKTPKALKMRSVHWINYLGEDETLYFKADEERKYRRMIVTSTVRDQVARRTMASTPEAFPSQRQKVFRILRKSSMAECLGAHTLIRPPTEESLRERSESLKTQGEKRTGRSGPGTSLEAPKYEPEDVECDDDMGDGDAELSDCEDEVLFC